MASGMRDLLIRGVAAAKAGDKGEARFYLEWALRLDPPAQIRIEASYWMSETCDDPAEKRAWLEDVLALNLSDRRARRALAILDGKLDPGEIIDPDQLPRSPAGDAQAMDARRFECPQCGGRMVFNPEGTALICEYCQLQGTDVEQVRASRDVAEQDFVIALATARGHTHRVEARAFTCKACGAGYVLAPETISLTCAHCDAVYVIEERETVRWIQPEGIVPFQRTQDQAHARLAAWLKDKGFPPRPQQLDLPKGIYLPVWTFDVGGTLEWRGYEANVGLDNYSSNQSGRRLMEGQAPVAIDDLLLPAKSRLSGAMTDELIQIDPRAIVAYDPAFLANWPAETYNEALSDAALRARSMALQQAKASLHLSRSVSDLVLSSANMAIDSYKLILIPVWLGHVNDQGRRYEVLINDQNGVIHGDLPPRGIAGWVSKWLDD